MTRALTAVSSATQDDMTPLHCLCYNKSVKVELIRALHGFYPAAAGEKDGVRPAAAARHAR